MAEVPKALEGLTWRDISMLQLRAQRKVRRRETLTDDERRVWEYITRVPDDARHIPVPW